MLGQIGDTKHFVNVKIGKNKELPDTLLIKKHISSQIRSNLNTFTK